MPEPSHTAAVIGVGLIGSAFAAAIKATGRFRDIVGSDTNAAASERALLAGMIDRSEPDPYVAVAHADLVVLASPVREIIRLIGEIGPHLKAGALVMDLGSTKAQIVAAMEQLPTTVAAVGGHPMTGPMTTGLGVADPRMFHDRIFVLTPTKRTSTATLDWCTAVLRQIGATVIVMDAERHDHITAIISHLPRFLPVALLDVAVDSGDALTMQLAAGGFRESTRKATDNIDMWTDVALTNAPQLIIAIHALQSHLDALAQTIATGDEATIRAALAEAQRRWEQRFR